MLHDTVQQLESIYLNSRNDSPVCTIFTGQELSSSIHNRYRIDSLTMAISKQSILGGDNEVSPLLSQYPSVDGDIQTLGFRPKASSRHLRDLHILSFTFLFVFLAYSASQNLESTLNTDKDLGTMSLGILYLSFALFSLVATLVVRRLGSKNSLILGTSGFWLFIAANFRPSWYTMVPASVYVGFTASVIWVGAGTYLTCAAKDHATECGLPEGRVIGNFNGEFWGMCASTQVIGNLFSLILLKNGMVETVLTASVVQAGKSTLNTTLLFTVFLGSMTLGTILACFLSKQSGTKAELTVQHSFESDSSLQNQVKAIFVPLLDRRMLLLIPLFAYSGLQQSFVWYASLESFKSGELKRYIQKITFITVERAELTKYVISPALGVLGVGGAMAIYGASDTICSLVAGRLTTGLLSITFITCGGMLFQVLVILRLWLKHSGFTTGGMDLANLLGMTAIWGIGNGIFNTQISALLGILFAHNTEAAFSQFKVWQSTAISAALFVSPHITFASMLALLAATMLVSLGALLISTLWLEKGTWVKS